MLKTQQDVRHRYESEWKQRLDKAANPDEALAQAGVEDAIVQPMYRQLIVDQRIHVQGGRVLDVGCGSGRWIRFFLDHFRPALLMGVDVTRASMELLETWSAGRTDTPLRLRQADITDPTLDLGKRFDLINIANVLFHIPEPDLFLQALKNLAKHVLPTGRIVTTEYLPRASMRTDWMLVRSRFDFASAVAAAGLRIVDVKAFGFFGNDPFGLDGPDHGIRFRFNRVRQKIMQILTSTTDDPTKRFFLEFFTELEHACLGFCRERLADIDLPSQKLVVLAPMGCAGSAGA